MVATLRYETLVLYICHQIGHSGIIDSSPSTSGFSKETDMDLLEAVSSQQPKHLAKYVSIVLDEMHVKEGLFFDKHTGALVGYADLGETNNILLDYEQHLENSGRTPRPVAKCMLVFMIRGLFTSLKFPYVQYLVLKVLIFSLWFVKL